MASGDVKTSAKTTIETGQFIVCSECGVLPKVYKLGKDARAQAQQDNKDHLESHAIRDAQMDRAMAKAFRMRAAANKLGSSTQCQCPCTTHIEENITCVADSRNVEIHIPNSISGLPSEFRSCRPCAEYWAGRIEKLDDLDVSRSYKGGELAAVEWSAVSAQEKQGA